MNPLASIQLRRLSVFVRDRQIAFHAENKAFFLREGRWLADRLAADLGLRPGHFRVAEAFAGDISRAGAVILHADHLLVTLGTDVLYGSEKAFCFCGCYARDCHTRAPNRWVRWVDLPERYQTIIADMREAISEGSALIAERVA
jgi:hypothetical protein